MSTKFLVLSFVVLGITWSSVIGQQIAVLTEGNVLMVIDRDAPNAPLFSETITGLLPEENLLGIDVRPATGQLYGLGSSSRLYTIDLSTASATPVGAGFATLLSGTAFGFDFNPTVDRIRIVSNTGQNLRAHPVTGAIAFVDSSLVFAATDPNAAAMPQVAGAGYTNSFAGTTSTTLFDIDTNLDVLVTQIPPNAGVLNTVGSLGMNVMSVAGFDISGETGEALAAVRAEGSPAPSSVLVTINLMSGLATPISPIGVASAIRGLAILRPAGVVRFGTSSAGCNGPIGMGVNSNPTIGNSGFILHASNAAPNMPALAALTLNRLFVPEVQGGLSIWLDFNSPSLVLELSTDSIGRVAAGFAIPMIPMLQGQTIHAQIGVGDPCIAGGIAATKGLAITFQP